MRHNGHIFRKALAPLLPLLALATLLGEGAAPAQAHPAPAPATASTTASAPGAAPASASGSAPARAPRAVAAAVWSGEAFDTCIAPPEATMRAWRAASPFGAVGVYVGGRGRACPNQPHLSRSWVADVHAMGWQLLPVYVGSQSPCVSSARKRKVAMGYDRPAELGASEGRDAVASARALGMVARSAVYLDMEAYGYRNARCAATTLAFVQGWNRAVRAAGYVPGFYSSANSGVAHMQQARRAGSPDLPEAVWFARWRVRPSLDGEKVLDRTAWQPHRRIHQYQGNVKVTYGGKRLNIDRNIMDAPVAVIG